MNLKTLDDKEFLEFNKPFSSIKKRGTEVIKIEDNIVKVFITSEGLVYLEEGELKTILNIKGVKDFSIQYKDGVFYLITKDIRNNFDFWEISSKIEKYSVTLEGSPDTFLLRYTENDLYLIYMYQSVVAVRKHSEEFKASHKTVLGDEREVLLLAEPLPSSAIKLYTLVEDSKSLTNHLRYEDETYYYAQIPLKEDSLKEEVEE